MSKNKMPSHRIQCNEAETFETDCDCKIFESKDEMRTSLKRLCYGDLYVIGRLWIEALRSVLVGHKLSLIPAIEAAAPPPTPQRPPPMKLKDLPIYKTPHYEYKQFLDDKLRCSDYKVKIIHQALLPYVKNCRMYTQESIIKAREDLKNTSKEVCSYMCQKRNEFENAMRDPNQLCARRVCVLSGALIGGFIGYKRGKGVMKPLVYSGLGALFTGALCFPKETDEEFRNFCYNTSKAGIALLNMYCNKNFAFRERIPCERDKPPLPKDKKEQCKTDPKKKKT